ncbi:MAG: hypothetical protein LBD44_04400 [Spirochaetaceae bacterium]|jgi:hypothetical protein|nr:hypothetical protein [Spirochaetaceae bacterium]
MKNAELTVVNGFTGSLFTVESGGKLTLEGSITMNGNNITASGAFVSVDGGTLTIKNGGGVSV